MLFILIATQVLVQYMIQITVLRRIDTQFCSQTQLARMLWSVNDFSEHTSEPAILMHHDAEALAGSTVHI